MTRTRCESEFQNTAVRTTPAAQVRILQRAAQHHAQDHDPSLPRLHDWKEGGTMFSTKTGTVIERSKLNCLPWAVGVYMLITGIKVFSSTHP